MEVHVALDVLGRQEPYSNFLKPTQAKKNETLAAFLIHQHLLPPLENGNSNTFKMRKQEK
jgi:hypothetical protein